MSDYDETLQRARSLELDERLKLIARLWASLPREYWPAANPDELADANRTISRQGIAHGDEVPWPVVEQMLADCVRSSRPKVYSAPRRFDLATMFVVTSAYVFMFAAMTSLRFPPVASILSATFITLVGIGQSVLFAGRKPRTASIAVGAATYYVFTVGWFMITSHFADVEQVFRFMMISGVVSGVALGYIAGVLVGGVFLIADKLRRLSYRRADPADPAEVSNEQPVATG